MIRTLREFQARRRFRVRLRPRWLVLFFRDLQMLLGAGILLADALETLARRFPDRATRRVMAHVHSDLAGACSRLSGALGKFPRTFPTSILAVIAAGEEAGSLALAERFGDLADRLAYEEAHRRAVRQACAYPALSIALASGLFAFLVQVTIPKLQELLRSLGGTLPPLTRAMLAFAALLRAGLPWVALGGIGAAMAAIGLRRWRRGRPIVDRLLLRIPIGGRTYAELAAALFCKVYRTLYLAGQAAPEILAACVPLVGNQAFRDAIGAARRDIVQRGATLSSALDRTKLFPPVAILALETGERSGRLGESLERVSAFLEARARERIAFGLGLLNPVLTLLVVAAVGLILAAFFQAMYQIVYVVH